ncbi:MAG: metalloregulator ArsR/SmtB family transcription factor [Bacteroidia bacterium]|nr:metalloregulator ArsR/SmtB family transcription factor [Bacteroidia bacterium]
MVNNLINENHELLARYAKALGHPVRVYIIELLSSQSCCFSGDLAEDLPIARSTLSQHLKELKSAGLIQGTIEYPKIRYCINKGNLEKARSLFGDLFQLNPVHADSYSNQ